MIRGTIAITEDGVISVIHPSSEGGLKLDGRMAMTTTPVHPVQFRSVKNMPPGIELEIELVEELVNPMGGIVDQMDLSQNQPQCKWQRFAVLAIGEISIPPIKKNHRSSELKRKPDIHLQYQTKEEKIKKILINRKNSQVAK